MNRIALGTVQFGMKYGISNQMGQVLPEEIKTILNIAMQNSIDTLDTAISYADSEISLGKNDTDSFNIITKIPKILSSTNNASDWILNQFSSSLIRLNKKEIYGLLLHSPGDLLGPHGDTIFNSLINLRVDGKVKKIGISVNSIDEIDILTEKYEFDMIQVPFNVLDRRLVKTGALFRLKDKGYEIHARSVFLQGLLLMSELERPTKFSKWNFLFNQWSEWLKSQSISALQGAIQFALSYPEIDKIVVGVQNNHQLLDILNAVEMEKVSDFPQIECIDEKLITPSNWSTLS